MPADRKPTKGAYRRKRQRERKAQRFEQDYGSVAYIQAIHAEGCFVARASWWLYADGTVRGGLPAHVDVDRLKPCSGDMEAAHRVKKRRRESRGWRDVFCLCTAHHAQQEASLARFEALYGVQVEPECDRMAERHGYLVPAA